MLKKTRKKVIVILGSTASGKTSLGVKLAKHFQGEIISADSRQVFKGMDIGTGKDLSEYNVNGIDIPYHLMDLVSPKTPFNIVKYQKLAKKALKDITQRDKLPIIVGGSGLYLQAIIDNYCFVPRKPDLARRKELDALSTQELYDLLVKTNKEFADKLNDSDKYNPRRLIRYIEITEQGEVFEEKPVVKSEYDFLILGLNWPDDVLRARIKKRLVYRLENENMIAEVELLRENGVTWKRLNDFGLEYRFIAYYLQGKLDYKGLLEQLETAIYRFAKRQKTWFKRWEKQGRDINWVSDLKEAQALVEEFTKKTSK